MTLAPMDIEIVVHFGTAERRVPLVALAAILRVPTSTLRDALGGILFAGSEADDAAADAAPVVGGRGERFVSIVSFHERERSLQKIVSTKGGGAGEENTPRPTTITAERLAAALDDWPSLGHLRQIVARHPPELLDDALRRTLAVPRDRIRTSRGAYFTGVVRALVAGSPPRLNS